MKLARIINMGLGRHGAQNHADRRLVGIVQGVATGFGTRLIGILVSFLSVPLTINYLGTERYGIWVALGSLLTWLQLADLGIANGLTNAVATAVGHGRDDLARRYISSSLVMLSLISVGTGLVGLAVGAFVDWNDLLGVKTALGRAEVGPAITLAFLIFLVQFPLAVIGRVFLAYQEGKLANYWSAGGNLASLIVLLLVTGTHGGLPLLVVAISGTNLAVSMISAVWLFTRHRPSVAPKRRDVQLAAMKEVSSTGTMFFLIQILSLIVFQTDNLVIAHYLGAAEVTPYNVTYKLFSYTSLLQTLLFSYVWVAYTEAIARRDIGWVQSTFHRTLILGTLSTLALAVPLIFVATPFIRWWAGDSAVPPFSLLVWMAVWSVINAFCGSIASLLAAASHMKAQLGYSTVSAILNVGLSIYLVQHWGAVGVIVGSIAAYLVAICIPAFIDVELLLRRLQRNSARPAFQGARP